jgi:probable blue pigment (indigoidine) exporter
MSRASRTPVALGLTAVGLAVVGLSILLYGTYVGVRDAHVVRYLYPALTPDALIVMVPAMLLVAGLLIGAVVVLARRDAGRSALVWLCGVGSVVALVLLAGHVLLLRNWNFDVWIGPPAWVGGLGGLLTMLALAGATVSFAVPSARRAFAPAAAVVAGPPAPLQAAASRFAVGGVLSLAGAVLLISGSAGAMSVARVFFVVLTCVGVVAGTTGAYLAARAARQGRPIAAHLARIAGVVLLLMQVWSLYQGTHLTVAHLYVDAIAVDNVPLGAAMLATVVAAVAVTLGGFAGLADPRSERFLRRPAPPVYHGWQSGPSDDPAPAGGYTAP